MIVEDLSLTIEMRYDFGSSPTIRITTKMQKKERLKPLSLYGMDLKEALHGMLSVDPRKLNLKEEKAVSRTPKRRKTREE